MRAGVPPSLFAELESRLGEKIHQALRCSGGSINSAYQLLLADGRKLFAKTNTSAADDFFRCEANGLRALAASNSLKVARVVLVTAQFLVLDWIEPGEKQANYNSDLATGLSNLHSAAVENFGFTENNYCGLTPQSNTPLSDGYRFFAEQRLMAQGKLAFDNGKLNSAQLNKLEQLAMALHRLIPDQSPALLHGDLWGGNIVCNELGEPVLIDPACYWGWPETDLAMMQLFGGFDIDVLQLYQQHRPLEPGFSERAPIYNLYHLLNHLNLFGSTYRGQVIEVLNSY